MLRTVFRFCAISLGFLGLGLHAQAQGGTSASIRPKMTIVVQEQASGAELVNVTMLSAAYPRDLLLQQINRLGTELGIPPRGVQIFEQRFGESEGQKLIKAQFATDDLVDRATGTLNLQPLARAFTGAPSPYTIDAMKVIFDGEQPSTNTLRTYSNEGIAVDGEVFSQPPSVEYLLVLKTQDPAGISIPLSHQIAAPQGTPAAPNQGVPMNVLIGLIVMASVAAGALVYFVLVSRGGNGPTSSSRTR